MPIDLQSVQTAGEEQSRCISLTILGDVDTSLVGLRKNASPRGQDFSYVDGFKARMTV